MLTSLAGSWNLKMAAIEPSKQDITAIFKRLRSIQTNKQCFDCRANNPTWASVTYGVFLCIDCSAVHRGLGVHLTFIRSTQLDTNWTWLQLRAMQVGGNANANAFFRQHGCDSNDAQQKYNSRAAQMYRDKLHHMATRAMQTHGTKVRISGSQEPTSPEHKEVDFFEEHEKFQKTIPTTEDSMLVTPALSDPMPISNGSLSKAQKAPEEDMGAPNVEAALSMSPTQAVMHAEPRKATIGTRKPASAKKARGLGARKGGFGAQKVKTNFSEIEASAQLKDKEKEEMAATYAAQEAANQAEEEKRMASMRLAYQDLTVERKKQEEKLKTQDPKKAKQMERLGMGMTGSRGVSHSAISDMTTISQENPNNNRDTSRFNSRSARDFDDDFELVSNYPPKFDSPFGVRKEDSWGVSSNKSSSFDIDRFESRQSTVEDIPHKEVEDRGRSRKTYEVSASGEAQKKFGNAKAISSDQFFGGKDTDFEMKQNLSRFEGSGSISSADLFGGNGPTQRSGTGYSNSNSGAGPDLAEIREGVKQGVTKVAGKLSSLANGMITSIQDHYG